MRHIRWALLWGIIAASSLCMLFLAHACAQIATKPVLGPIDHRAIAITAGGDAVLRDDGRVIGFKNTKNQEGSDPVFIEGLRDIVDVAGFTLGIGPEWPLPGETYWIALRRSGEVLQWNGHCRDDGIYDCSFSRAAVVPKLRNVTKIASGSGTHLAIDRDGQVWGWGLDYDGLITGQKSERNRFGFIIPRLIKSPIKIPLPTPMKAIAIGFPHSIGIDRTGAVWLWGANDEQRNLPERIETHTNGTFVARKVLNVPPAQAAASRGRMFVLTNTGELWSWGLIEVNRTPPTYGTRVPNKLAAPCRIKSFSVGSYVVATVCDNGAIYRLSFPPPSFLQAAKSCQPCDAFDAAEHWEREQAMTDIEVLHISPLHSNAYVSMIDRSGLVYLSATFGPGHDGVVLLPSRERILGPISINPERNK